MTEDLAWRRRPLHAADVVGRAELERTFAVLQGKDRTELMFRRGAGLDARARKMRLGGSILHFDPYLIAAAGVVDSALPVTWRGTPALA